MVFNLPKDCDYLTTNYFRLINSDEVNRFLKISWECLTIIKENFCSKVKLYEENINKFI